MNTINKKDTNLVTPADEHPHTELATKSSRLVCRYVRATEFMLLSRASPTSFGRSKPKARQHASITISLSTLIVNDVFIVTYFAILFANREIELFLIELLE